MKTMFESLTNGLNEVESYLTGEREGYKVNVFSDVDVMETLQPQDTEE